jgi:hypothetical protein
MAGRGEAFGSPYAYEIVLLSYTLTVHLRVLPVASLRATTSDPAVRPGMGCLPVGQDLEIDVHTSSQNEHISAHSITRSKGHADTRGERWRWPRLETMLRRCDKFQEDFKVRRIVSSKILLFTLISISCRQPPPSGPVCRKRNSHSQGLFQTSIPQMIRLIVGSTLR